MQKAQCSNDQNQATLKQMQARAPELQLQLKKALEQAVAAGLK